MHISNKPSGTRAAVEKAPGIYVQIVYTRSMSSCFDTMAVS